MKKLFAAIGLDVFRNQQDILYTCICTLDFNHLNHSEAMNIDNSQCGLHTLVPITFCWQPKSISYI